MRLVCPNCEAKYEVPDDAIPDTGRDVQCANCGHSWFQMRPRAAAAVVEETPPQAAVDRSEPEETYAPAEIPATAEPAPTPEPEPEVVVEPEQLPDPVVEPAARLGDDPAPEAVDVDVAAGTEVSSSPQAEAGPPAEVPETFAADTVTADTVTAEIAAAEIAATDTAAADVVVAPPPEDVADLPPENSSSIVEDEATPAPTLAPVLAAATPYAVDASVLAILREEAEREASVRRAEGQTLETQPDLGLSGASSSDARPLAVSVGSSVDNDASARPSARRDLLPDVEEINSTLRPSEVAMAEDAGFGTTANEARGGFRSGFLMVMTLAIIGAAVYITAPRISAMVPSVADPLATYVAGVDSLRLALDGLMRSATVAINGE